MAENQNAQALPEHIRQAVIDECKRRAIPNPLLVIFIVALDVLLIMVGVSAFRSDAELILRIVWGTLFFVVPLLITHMTFIRPLLILKRAKQGDYEFHIGILTAAEKFSDEDGTDHYMTLDGTLKCSCTRKQYKRAVIGDRYIAAFFDKDYNIEVCAHIPHDPH